MTEHDWDTDSAPEPGMSRRGMVRTAAQAGAVGLAGGLVLRGTTAAAATPAEHAAPAPAPEGGHEPVVVHVRDARTGELDVFRGHEHRRVYDRDLAAALMRAAG